MEDMTIDSPLYSWSIQSCTRGVEHAKNVHAEYFGGVARGELDGWFHN